jgi:hypothetical protein
MSIESRSGKSFEDYEVINHFCTEQDVYNVTGMDNAFLQNLSRTNSTVISNLVNNYIKQAEDNVRRKLGVPNVIRKEKHMFFNNPTIQLGGDREDEYEMGHAYDPQNKVEEIHSIWYNGRKLVSPFPKNMDGMTEPTSINSWAATNGTVTINTINRKCGKASIEATITGENGGNIYYPSAKNMNLRIYPWFYVGFWLYTSDKNAIFTFSLVRDTESAFEYDFKCSLPNVNAPLANTWVPIGLNIRNFKFNNVGGEGVIADFNWILIPTQYIKISVDRPCTFAVDNFCFNDGLWGTYPSGEINWAFRDWYPTGTVHVSYTYNPYANDIPDIITSVTSKLAAVKLLDWCLGKRAMTIAFDQLSDSLEEDPDKVSLEGTRKRLMIEANEELGVIGVGGFEGIC